MMVSHNSHTENSFILILDLAGEVGQHRVNLLKDLKRRGYELIDVRDPTTGNQKAKAVSRLDAEAYVTERQREGFGKSVKKGRPEEGFVYVIVPDPELRADRVKIGWTTNLDQRLGSYRAIAPELCVLRIWPAKTQAIETVTLLVAERFAARIGMELFDVPTINVFLQELDGLFAVLGIVSCHDLHLRADHGTTQN
jgi:hypothetical protein